MTAPGDIETILKTLFDASTLDAMPTEVILSRLTELPESPWGDLGGKPINDRKLGRRLREYGVKSKVIRVGDRTPRGYLREDLQDAWLRYLPAHDAAEAQQTQQVQQEARTGGFSQKNVAETEENERNGSATSATDVADSKRNSPPERNGNISTKSSIVVDVADVALVRGNGGEAPGDDLDIPAFLDRSRKQDPHRLCPLGPGGDGDSLDDLV